MLTTKKHF